MIEIASLILVYLAYAGFCLKRLMTYMHVLQQEEYDSKRLLQWITTYKTYDKRLSFMLLILGAGWIGVQHFWPYTSVLYVNFLTLLALSFAASQEKDPRKKAKKKLVATARAKRIFIPAFALLLVLAVAGIFISHPLFWIVSVQIIPLILALVNLALLPFEDIVQQRYWNEANAKVQALKPKIIAITGSFGKTSVKHILGHILKTQAPTIITPGSVNTPMGIARIIREELDETHDYMVVEMGAYGPGSIAGLCQLTPPDFGIITAIGHAHYERFKSLETVSQAKYELAEAVIKNGGKVVVHERTLRFPHPRQMKMEHKAEFIVCGEPPAIDNSKNKDASYIEPDDLNIHKVQQSAKGLSIVLSWRDKTHNLEVPLYGVHHGHNVALAFAAALELGIAPKHIQNALKSLPQISHRLEVKTQPDNIRIIDDAYNSNPLGFRSALDLLVMLEKQGRSILVTPGMIELGNTHDEAHQKLGEYAGQVCDVVIVINGKRIPTFVNGFKSSGSGKQLIEVNTFHEAAQWIDKNKKSGDVILLENDLPDIYENIPKM